MRVRILMASRIGFFEPDISAKPVLCLFGSALRSSAFPPNHVLTLAIHGSYT